MSKVNVHRAPANRYRPAGYAMHRKANKPTPIRYVPLLDNSRYPGAALWAIRARKVNFKGEPQR
jgi:hypothetical protein